MIETKILGDAVGVQRGDVIDNSETTVLPSLANGVVVGKFKRGRTDKPFKVTSSNYRSLLGYDPSNPNYLAVEDAFKRGISEISILRVGDTGGGIKCIASFAEIVGVGFGVGESVGDFLTVSRNGGEFFTINLGNMGTDWNDIERITMYGQDGKSLAFLDHSYSLSGHPDIGQNCYWSWCGIDSSGIIKISEGTFDLKNEEIETYDTSLPPHKVRPEHNWLVFKPTPDVEPSLDAYYRITGSDTNETIEVHGCAVIDFNTPAPLPPLPPMPSTCQPTFFTMKSDIENYSSIVGEVHAKYRINGGEWAYYTHPNDTGYNPINIFFNSLLHNDWPMINVGGGGGAGAFCTSYYGLDIYGAHGKPPFFRNQYEVVSPVLYTLEFAVTANNDNDLIYLAFGRDVIMNSCAIGNWMGY